MSMLETNETSLVIVNMGSVVVMSLGDMALWLRLDPPLKRANDRT